jgi:hypothetical protein
MRRALLISLMVIAGVAAVGGIATAQTGTAPVVVTGDPSDVTQQGAKLNGTVNPQGKATTYTFQFGLTTSYGAQTTPASAGSGTTAAPVSATLTGLAPGTTYHYRISATNSDGQTTTGADRTFTTAARSSRLELFGHTAFVGPGRQVGVFTGCLGHQACRGSLRMTSGGTTIGSRRSFFIRANGGGIVHVPLNSAGRSLVRRRGTFRTQVTVSSATAGTDGAAVTVVRYADRSR